MAKKKNGNGKSNGHSNGNGVASRNKSLLGHNAIFTPEVMDDIHIKSELGRYRMRGMALMKKIPTFDDLVFLPGTLTRFVIEGYREKCETKTIIGPRCENPIELDIPVYITGTVSYTHLRAHETVLELVCRLLLEKKIQQIPQSLSLIHI